MPSLLKGKMCLLEPYKKIFLESVDRFQKSLSSGAVAVKDGLELPPFKELNFSSLRTPLDYTNVLLSNPTV